jgi:tetratricopeptide (TPR) repeat protein
LLGATVQAAPRVPTDDGEVLASLPAGVRHSSAPALELTRARLDVALPLAQFYIARSRATGDLRFLGYAEAVLVPWMRRTSPPPQVLTLHATMLQSRHDFEAALKELDRALSVDAANPQAWLTRATVLRVLGRYDEALASCRELAVAADPAVVTLCTQGVLGLSGHLQSAYATLVALPEQALAPEVRAWRFSELGEMAERLGHDVAAERWLRVGLRLAPDDFYLRGACVDLLLRDGRAAEALTLLHGYESMEPMLLRLVIARQMLGDPNLAALKAQLANAFDIEAQRGDAVHRREQARYLLDVARQPQAALLAAQQNWAVQREPDDVSVLLQAAQAAARPEAAQPALQFLQWHGLEDARLSRLAPP